ncbi:MAG: sensor histidine kinase [Planctomycetota bacterium]|nr:sensor histidine kinase [Planctomycetota bacterium]
MSLANRVPSHYRWISQPLFGELLEMLDHGRHIALIAPRQSGKAVVLYELKRLAELRTQERRPRVRILRASKLVRESNDEFLGAIAKELGVNGTHFANMLPAGTPLSTSVQELIASAVLNDPGPLWIFVQSVPELKSPHARALLEALRYLSEDASVRGILGVVVTGSHDFVPLTYDSNSPYRHADQRFLIGFDRETSRTFFVSRVLSESLARGLELPSIDEKRILPEASLDLLYDMTAGYARFIEEIVIAHSRPGLETIRVTPGSPWPAGTLESLIDRFVDEFLPFEPYCRLALREIETDRPAWKELEGLVLGESSDRPDRSAKPHRLETAGIVHRTGEHQWKLASPIWEKHLKRLFTQRYRADVRALQGDWNAAWALYEGTRSAECERVIDGESRYSWRRVERAWQGTLLDQVGDGTRKLWQFFCAGLKSLFGVTCCMLYDRRRGHVLEPIGTSEFVQNDQVKSMVESASALLEQPDEIDRKPRPAFQLQSGRAVLISVPAPVPNWSDLQLAPVLYIERPRNRPIDSVSLAQLQQVIRRFWQALYASVQIESKSELGDTLKRHMQVGDAVNQMAWEHRGNLRKLVEGTARALIESGGYYRVLICLVSPDGSRIQTAASHCRDPKFDFFMPTDFQLDTTSPDASLDVQQWVALKGKPALIRDATDPMQQSPCAQLRQADSLQMYGIAVVPINLASPGGEIVETIGTLHLERKDKIVPGEAETRALGTLAGQLALVFDQARRENLLESALDQVDNAFRILSRDSRVLYRNRSAAQLDNEPARVWRYPFALLKKTDDSAHPPVSKVATEAVKGEPVHRYVQEEVDGKECVFDEFCAPIVDFRAKMEREFSQFGGAKRKFVPDGFLGYVHQTTDLTIEFENSTVLQKWLTIADVQETADRIVAFLAEKGATWVRIYRYSTVDVREGVLTSLAERGIPDVHVARRFREGKFQIHRTDHGEQVWYLLDQQPFPHVCVHETSFSKGMIEPFETELGVRGIRTCDQWREEFEKEDGRWIEAPLIVGDERVGLIAMSLPERFTPQQYERFRGWFDRAAVALYHADRACGEIERARTDAFEYSAQLTIHQLTNKLNPVSSNCEFSLRLLEQSTFLGAEQARLLSYLKKAKNSLTAARGIVKDFRRYATTRPLDDIETLGAQSELSRLKSHLMALRPECLIEIDSSGGDISFRGSPTALVEVFEILVNNSLTHGVPIDGQHRMWLTWHASTGGAQGRSGTRECRLVYRDNGGGISPDVRSRIFEPFFTTSQQGNGLGLAIARRLMERQHGTIEETGAAGVGCQFELTLPLSETPRNEPP